VVCICSWLVIKNITTYCFIPDIHCKQVKKFTKYVLSFESGSRLMLMKIAHTVVACA